MFLYENNVTLGGQSSGNDSQSNGGYLGEISPSHWPDYESDDTQPPPAMSFQMRFVAFTVLGVAAIICNFLSICALMRIRGPRTVHHTFLMNLAACDMVGATLLWMYYNSPLLFPRFPLTNLLQCLFITVVLVAPVILSLCTSSLSLLMLALNQYIAICSPLLSATRVTRGRAIIVIICVWLVSTLLAMVPGLLTLFMSVEGCGQDAQSMGVKSLEICGYFLAGLILIIVVLYCIIYREVLRYRRRIPQLQATASFSSNSRLGVNPNHTTRRSDTEHNYKAFITTFLLTGTLVIFWLPYMVFNFLSDHVNMDSVPDAFLYVKFYVIDFLPLLNFVSDPVIYGIRIREIRLAYRKMFAKVFPCCISEPRHQTNRGSVRFTSLDTSM